MAGEYKYQSGFGNEFARILGVQVLFLRVRTILRSVTMVSMLNNSVALPSQLQENTIKGLGCTEYFHQLNISHFNHTLTGFSPQNGVINHPTLIR